MLFDLNDFDETLPGPWEWDVKRMAASFVIGARAVGFPKGTGRQAAMAAVESYRVRMAEYAGDARPRRLVQPHHVGRDPGRHDHRQACASARTQ